MQKNLQVQVQVQVQAGKQLTFYGADWETGQPLFKSFIMKFNTGDRVRIVKYGSVMWCPANDEYFEWAKKLKILKEENGILTVDTHPEWIGEEAIVEKGKITQNMEQYILQLFNKSLPSAWYSVNQLELVNPNINETTMVKIPHKTGTP